VLPRVFPRHCLEAFIAKKAELASAVAATATALVSETSFLDPSVPVGMRSSGLALTSVVAVLLLRLDGLLLVVTCVNQRCLCGHGRGAGECGRLGPLWRYGGSPLRPGQPPWWAACQTLGTATGHDGDPKNEKGWEGDVGGRYAV